MSRSEAPSSNPPVILKGDNLVDVSSIPASVRNSKSSSGFEVWKTVSMTSHTFYHISSLLFSG